MELEVDKEEHRFKKEHYKIILDWLENPRNFERLHGSRSSKTKDGGLQKNVVVPKRVVYGELVRHLQQKARVKILGLDAHKMQSRHKFLLSKFKSAKNQSERAGFGVTPEDQAKKIPTVAAKLEKLCPLYSRMLALYGDKPDIVSPSPALGCFSGAKRLVQTSSDHNNEEGEEVEEVEEEAGTKTLNPPRRDNAACQNVVSDAALSDLPDVASPTGSDIQVPVPSIPVSSVGGSQAGLRSNNRGADSEEENTSFRGDNRRGNSLPDRNTNKKRDTGKTKEKEQQQAGGGGGGLEARFAARQASMTAHLSEKMFCELEWKKEEMAMQDRRRREDREDRERLRAIEREEREVERQSQKDQDIRTFLLQLISQNKSPQEIEEYMQIFRRHY